MTKNNSELDGVQLCDYVWSVEYQCYVRVVGKDERDNTFAVRLPDDVTYANIVWVVPSGHIYGSADNGPPKFTKKPYGGESQ